jgi:hypothetical protein
MTFELTPNQFHTEVYDLTVHLDNLPEVHMDAIRQEADTTYWYGENNGFVRYGISHNRRVFNHEPGYMWSSRSSVFNGKFPNKCHCKEVTICVDGTRYHGYAMTVPAIIALLGEGYELFGLVKDGEYSVEIGEAYQILTNDITDSHGEILESFLC